MGIAQGGSMIILRDQSTPMGKHSRVYFDSMQEAARLLDQNARFKSSSHCGKHDDSHYGKSWAGVMQMVNKCDQSKIDRITKILDKVDSSFDGREKLGFVPSFAGAYPVVPEFLAGNPECMRVKQSQEDDRAPIRIFIGITVSSGVDMTTAEKRGAAAAALAMKLAQERPVELYAYSDMHSENTTEIVTYKIGTAPISDNDIAFALGSIEALRRIAFGVSCLTRNTEAGYIQWAWGQRSNNSADYMASLRVALGCNDADVVLSGGHLDEVNEMAADPVAWVHSKLDAQREVIVD